MGAEEKRRREEIKIALALRDVINLEWPEEAFIKTELVNYGGSAPVL